MPQGKVPKSHFCVWKNLQGNVLYLNTNTREGNRALVCTTPGRSIFCLFLFFPIKFLSNVLPELIQRFKKNQNHCDTDQISFSPS